MKFSDAPTAIERHPESKTPWLPKMSRLECLVSNRPSLTACFREAAAGVAEKLSALFDVSASLELRPIGSRVEVSRLFSFGMAYAVLELAPLGAHALLEIERPLLAAMLERIAEGECNFDFASELTRIEEAAFGYVCLELLQVVRRRGEIDRAFSPRLCAVGLSVDALAPYFPLGGRYAVLSGRLKGLARAEGIRLSLPVREVVGALSSEKVPLPPASEQRLASIPYALSLRTRATRLTHGAGSSLVRGDVVLLDGVNLTGGQLAGSLILSRAPYAWDVKAREGNLTIQRMNDRSNAERRLPKGSTMDSDSSVAGERFVDVEVEMAPVRVTVAQFANLKEGSVVPFHWSMSEPVVLRIGGKNVARATLVDIEGEVGARITELL